MITEKAMLAAVHISIWTAVKHDRKVSREVADQHGAHQGAGRYNKQLLHGAQKLEELRTSRRPDSAALLQDHAAVVR